MDDLPGSVIGHLHDMFVVAEANQATGLLHSAAASLATRGAAPDHIERALTACLMAAERRTAQELWVEQTPVRRLREVAAAAGRLSNDLRGVLLEAGIELSDWHTHLEWTPARVPVSLNFPRPLDEMVRACETECVTACCGLSAYEVRADRLVEWSSGRGGLYSLTTSLAQLEVALEAVASSPRPVRGHDMLLFHEWETAAECLAYFDVWRVQATLALAEVGGPEVIRPEWLTTTVRAIAAGVQADRDFSRLPILADALEDAGCDSVPVLAHLRANSRHGWFCWVIDLLAGR